MSRERTGGNSGSGGDGGVVLPKRIELSANVISSYGIGRVVRQHSCPVLGLDYSADGALLAASSGADILSITHARSGEPARQVQVRKYGAGVIRFLRDSGAGSLVMASTTGGDHDIRALELARCSYARYYRGHSGAVTSLAASPTSPTFVSGARDSTMRLWDVRMNAAVAKLAAAGAPAVAFDPKGVVFGVVCLERARSTTVKLYDVKNYQQGPFAEFPIENPRSLAPSCFKFSSDGEFFLLCLHDNTSATVRLYDAYKGGHHRSFTGHRNDEGVAIEASFSPDAKYVATGSSDGSVFVWELGSNKTVLQRERVHAGSVSACAFNPVYAQMATACQNVALWVPDVDSLERQAQY